MQVAGVTWKQKQDTRFDAGLTVWRGEDQEPAFLPLPPGKQLSWLLRGPKRCTGRINATGRLERCPKNSVILSSGQKCGSCQAVNLVDPCIRCSGHRCAAHETRRLQCDRSTYVVYAVLFNDQTLKVGVSSKGRALTRWVEQGADYACVLRELEGGRNARRIEDRISRSYGITKQVRSERKTRALLDRLSISEARSILDDLMTSTDLLDIDQELGLQDLSGYYTLGELAFQPVSWRKRSDPVDGRAIVGENLGLKGSLMVTSAGTSLTAVDLRQIIGYTIDMDSDITLVTQTELADFF
ncbi:MAG: hypothetical protein C4K48_03845 [Candidatus Thorarchaeota archaeon]|nr:MAG: hypothetical protein C4K48_03845 [Candidatus Thorarchaeota archaeon]